MYNAVKQDGVKYADVAAQFNIFGCKSAGSISCRNRPYYALIRFKRQGMVPQCVLQIITKVVEEAMKLRNRHLLVLILVNINL
jgi:hypothetical protein